MIPVPDIESIAAMRVLAQLLGRRVGPSTGTNFVAVLQLIKEMNATGQHGSIVSLICDGGHRYDQLYDDAYVEQTFGPGLSDCIATLT